MAETLTMNDMKYLIDTLSHILRESNKEVIAILRNQQHVSVSSPTKPSPLSSPKVPSRSHDSKKSLVSKNPRVPVSASFSTTPNSVFQVPTTTEKATCVLAPYSPEVDSMVKCAFEVCLVDIFFLPYSCPPLKRTPTKVSAFPLSQAAADLELAEHQDDDSEDDETFFSRIAKELSSQDDVLSEEEDQVQDLNFIVEGCTFRGDIEIPTPPPSDAEQEDAPPDKDGRPWKDVRIPSPDNERFIPSAAFSRSRREERSNTPPDEFDRYLADSFRPVTVPLLPATPKAPPPQKSSQRAATTGVARAARAVPSSDIVARRLSYSDASFIHQSHGERDPSRAAVSDEDTRFDDDPDLDPDDCQDQALYDDILCGVAATSPSSSPEGYRSDSSSSPEGFRFDEPQFDSDGRSIASTCSSPSHYPDSDIDDYCGDAGDQYDYG
jgi:hypothetical protein